MKHSKPSNLLVWVYVAVFMRVILRGFWGFTSRTGSRVSVEGANDVSVSMEGDLLASCYTDYWKVMLPNTQSIKGL